MTEIIIALLYVIGFQLCYTWAKNEIMEIGEGAWTTNDRKIALLFSSLSFLGLGMFVLFFKWVKDEDKTEAGW